MSHVDFKKWPCRCVDFKGQGPLIGEMPADRSDLCHTYDPHVNHAVWCKG